MQHDHTPSPEQPVEIPVPEIVQQLRQSTLNPTLLAVLQEWRFQDAAATEAAQTITRQAADNYYLLKEVHQLRQENKQLKADAESRKAADVASEIANGQAALPDPATEPTTLAARRSKA